MLAIGATALATFAGGTSPCTSQNADNATSGSGSPTPAQSVTTKESQNGGTPGCGDCGGAPPGPAGPGSGPTTGPNGTPGHGPNRPGAPGSGTPGNPTPHGNGPGPGFGATLGAPGVNPSLGTYEPEFGPDLSVASQGYPGFSGSSYNGQQEAVTVTNVGGNRNETFAPKDSNGYQGKNWFQNSQPEMRRLTQKDGFAYVPPSDEFPIETETLTTVGITITFNANRRLTLWRESGSYYMGALGTSGVARDVMVEVPTGTVHVVRYYDKSGFEYDFFGWAHTPAGLIPDHATGQLWKVRDVANGVGHCGSATDPIAAATNGYDSTTKGIKSFTDASGTTYTYTYSTAEIGGARRLKQVEAKRGGSTIESVSYYYYGEANPPQPTYESAHGTPGDLKFVIRSVPQSSSGVVIDYVRYYRYYIGSYSDSGQYPNLGRAHLMKMVVDVEGFRRADMEDNGSLDRSCLSLTDAELLPYATTFLEYRKIVTTDNRNAFDGTKGEDYVVRRAIVGGSCGCSGSGAAGVYEYLHYERNKAHKAAADGGCDMPLPDRKFSWKRNPTLGTQDEVQIVQNVYVGNWDNAVWTSRVTIKRPDDTYAVVYFDRRGNVLGEVLLTIPSADRAAFTENSLPSSAVAWPRKFLRDNSGRIAAVCSTESITAYNHNINQACTTNPMPVSANQGLITYTEYLGSAGGHPGMMGAVKRRGYSKGLADITNNPAYKTEEYTYVAETSSGQVGTWDVFGQSATGTPNLVIADYLPSSIRRYTNTQWGSTGAPVEETTYTYSFHETGDPNSTRDNWRVSSRKRRLAAVPSNQNGAAADTEDYAYFDLYGRLTATVDALGKRDEFEYDGFGRLKFKREDVGSGGHNLVTEYAYDVQDRLVNVIAPDGNISSTYFSKLSDGRQVILEVPRVTTGGTYYGPASYSVQAQDGKSLASARLVFSGTTDNVAGTTSNGIGTWISPASSDVLGAVQHGSVTDLQTAGFTSDGQKRLWSRMYVAIPTALPGTSGTHYDQTSFEYDTPGRMSVTTDPSGTKTKSEYDTAGRPYRQLVSSGTNSFVLQSETTYDLGTVGNGHVTKVTEYADASVTRVTDYKYDFRGRRIVTLPSAPPYSVTNYDDLGRVTASATYSSSSGLNDGTNATTVTANRLTLVQSFYDTRSQLWKQERTVTNGGSSETLATLRWFDPRGRVIKESGAAISKTRYDRLGRPITRFTIARASDSAYADVFSGGTTSVADDTVLEESQTIYDAVDGNVLMTVAISRRHDDTTTTGALDSNADTNRQLVTAGNIAGRVQITSYWYDVLDRVTTSASYGTNSASANVATFDRSALTTAPTIDPSNAAILVSKTTYGADGRVLQTTDPMNRKQRREYDAAGRTVATIDNFLGGSLADVNRDADVYTRYQYFNGQQTKLWVDLDGDNVMDADDQVTTYVYGTSTSGTLPSLINTGHLLREVIYPEQSSGQSTADRTVRYAYNRLGEQFKTQDQAGNIIETEFDEVGREKARKAATVATDFDGLVRRIGMVYDDHGRVSTVTQYNGPSGGTVVDQVRYTYDGWGNIKEFTQDVDGAIGSFSNGVSRPSFGVGYDYALSTAGNEGGLTRRTDANYYRSDTFSTGNLFERVQYSYGASNSTNQYSNRVETVLAATGSASLAPVAKYDYLGWGQLVGTELFHVGGSARTALYNSSGAYADMDRFNRPTRWDWNRVIDSTQKGTFYDHSILYDNNSNIVGTTDHVHVRVGTGKNVFDLVYNNDGLNRLRGADQGNATGTGSSRAIETGTRTRNEAWATLSQTGNWESRQLDADGDGAFTSEADRFEPTAYTIFSNANEWKERRVQRDSQGNNRDDFGYSYDKNGNLVYESMTKVRPGQANALKQRGYVYDAFGRLRKVYNGPVGESQLIAEYRYNGLGFRTGWQYDADADGTVESSEQYHFMYDDRWRILATFRGFDENPKEAFVYHAAGFAGEGVSSYIDTVILRDRDASSPWTSQAASTLNERRYYVQNWRADVVALLTGDGKPWEFLRYSAYGEATVHPVADVNRDGIVNSTDLTDYDAIPSEGGDAAVGYDLDFDGYVPGDSTSVDEALLLDSYNANTGFNGTGRVGASSGNRKGYAGYEFDPVLLAYHVRHRVYLPEIGRWNKRDPLGYVDGMSLYAYVMSSPILYLDPLGLSIVFEWWEDFKDGIREIIDYWSDPPPVRQIIDDSSDDEALDEVQDALDTCSYVPIAGQAADIVNTGISLCRGDYTTAACSMIPGPGGNPGKTLPSFKPGVSPGLNPKSIPAITPPPPVRPKDQKLIDKAVKDKEKKNKRDAKKDFNKKQKESEEAKKDQLERDGLQKTHRTKGDIRKHEKKRPGSGNKKRREDGTLTMHENRHFMGIHPLLTDDTAACFGTSRIEQAYV